jgi:prepilin-type N-terminal cleavage/methylation domain-containing protein
MTRDTTMHRRPIDARPTTATWRGGFTLTELLVVMALIVILIAAAVPATNAMIRATEEKGVVHTIDSAVAAARAYATRPLVFQGGPYMGAAAVFTGNEIRIARHTEYDDSDNPVFTDQDDVDLAPSMSVAGMSRQDGFVLTPASGEAFAVRFDRHGVLISSRPSSDKLYHDGKSLPCVVGLIAYSRERLTSAHGGDLTSEATSEDNGDTGDKYEWIMKNGQAILFNRYSGARIKESP